MKNNKRIIISSVLAIAVVAGGFTIDNILGANKIKKNISTNVKSALLTSDKDFYNVGEIVKINGISVKIDKINISDGKNKSRPDKGSEYVTITVTVKNESSSKRSYGDDFQIQDNKGKTSDPIVTMIETSNTFKGGVLEAKGAVTGTITFLAVKGAKGLSLVYNWDILRHKIIRFKLN